MLSKLQVNRLAFAFDNRQLFPAISFNLQCGECLHIQGANGAGKTTMLELLSGLRKPDQGEILWCQQSIWQLCWQYYQEVFYVRHQPGIKLQLTLLENLYYDLRLQAVSKTDLVAMLHQFNLLHYQHERCHVLSQGQIQKVVWTKLLLSRAKLWLLDEPFASLDEQSMNFIKGCLRNKLTKAEICVVITHHHSLSDIADMQILKI